MKIAIIGAGNMGGALSKALVRTGHQVVISDRDPGEAAAMAAALGAESAPAAHHAAEAAEVVVYAIPFGTAAADVSRQIAPYAGGKIIVDATNPTNGAYDGLVTEPGPSAAERIQTWLPASRVVKAFNTVLAANIARPLVEGEPVDTFVAADDDEARETVLRLAGEMGLRPINAGPLARAHDLEAMAFLNIRMQIVFQGSWQSSWRLIAPPPAALRPVSEAAREAVDALMRKEAGPPAEAERP